MKQLFLAVLTIAVLVIYVVLFYIAVRVAFCISAPGCTEYPVTYFTALMSTWFASLNGLLSAVIISMLGITPPGKIPGKWILTNDSSLRVMNAAKIISCLYFIVWLFTGMISLFVAFRFPDAVPTLTILGKTWIGVVIAGTYAYWNLPTSKN